MLQTYKNNDPLAKIGTWLFCSGYGPIDCLICHHCRNYLMVGYIAFHEGDVISTQRIEKDTLQDAMRKLSEEQRWVLILKFVSGLSNKEVADILSKSISTVRAIQNRALITLLHLVYLN